MNKPKHTPGPWTHDSFPGNVTDFEGKLIHTYDHKNGRETADARLIAAAPEMFELLRAAGYTLRESPSLGAKIKALIARIEGGAK